jgi:hypothetical protein
MAFCERLLMVCLLDRQITAPISIEAAVVLAAVKDASRRWRGGPKAGHP